MSVRERASYQTLLSPPGLWLLYGSRRQSFLQSLRRSQLGRVRVSRLDRGPHGPGHCRHQVCQSLYRQAAFALLAEEPRLCLASNVFPGEVLLGQKWIAWKETGG